MQLIKHLILLLLLHFAFPGNVFSQLCQGSLGDPVVNITFGTGTGSAQTFNLPNYTFTSSTCPNDGFYTLTGSTPGCFASSWHIIQEDHTPGDTNGLMMLVNAAQQPSDFYLDTVNNLCANTTYEFAAWIMNVLNRFGCQGRGASPNLTFKLEKTDGTVLKSYETGEIPITSSPEWKQYGFFFSTPPGIDRVVIRLTNNIPGGNNCGNDLALDDITFRPCGPSVNAGISGLNGQDSVNFCEGDNKSYTLNGTVSTGYQHPALQWQVSNDEGANWTDINNATTNTYIANETTVGNHLYRLSVSEAGSSSSVNCRINSNIVRVIVNPLPQTNASNNSPVCGNADLILTAGGGSVYQWTGPNNFSASSQPVTISAPAPAYAGWYYVKVTTDKGCIKKDSTEAGIFPSAIANAGSDVTICEGASTQLNGSGGESYEWMPSTGLSSALVAKPDASPKDSAVYILTVTDVNKCKDQDTVAVNVLSKPSANAGPNKVIMEGQTTQLQGSAAGDSIGYAWSPLYNIDNALLLQPTVHPAQDATYTLNVTSKAGCGTSSDDVFVRVYKKVTVPNAFSPNSDGVNDTWHMDAIETYPECEVSVYNRYGGLVFHSRGYSANWNGTYNGKMLPIGTYYYVILLDKALPTLSGWVILLK